MSSTSKQDSEPSEMGEAYVSRTFSGINTSEHRAPVVSVVLAVVSGVDTIRHPFFAGETNHQYK